MHALPDFDFAGPTTRERCQSHNRELSALQADQAFVDRLGGELARLDPMTTDPDQAEQLARTVNRRRHANVKATVALLQGRLPILESLQEDRQRAEQEAAAGWEQRRAEVTQALAAAGYAHLLSDPNPAVKTQMHQFINAAASVVAAASCYGQLREHRMSLSEIAIAARAEIGQLTQKLRVSLQGTVHGEPRRSPAAV